MRRPVAEIAPAVRGADPLRAFLARAARDRERIAELADGLQIERDWSHVAAPHMALEDLAHGLAGTGGTFGFPSLSAAAARLERLMERRRLRPPARYTRKQIDYLAPRLAALIAELDAIARPDRPGVSRSPRRDGRQRASRPANAARAARRRSVRSREDSGS